MSNEIQPSKFIQNSFLPERGGGFTAGTWKDPKAPFGALIWKAFYRPGAHEQHQPLWEMSERKSLPFTTSVSAVWHRCLEGNSRAASLTYRLQQAVPVIPVIPVMDGQCLIQKIKLWSRVKSTDKPLVPVALVKLKNPPNWTHIEPVCSVTAKQLHKLGFSSLAKQI